MLSWLGTLIILAGVGQLIIAAASLSIPYLLDWKEETKRLRPLTREVFWTYACYIFSTNIALGIVSITCSAALLAKGPLALAILCYAFFYWGVRLTIQLFIMDKSTASIPNTFWYKLGNVMITLLFVYLTIVYAMSATHQLGWW
ncbi:MAG: hypothetical protein HY226_02275 [Candidatus Vogelbacteria bacterium]|nr:hypothetical protein [Candidatus Vogelbacteria bacterium]